MTQNDTNMHSSKAESDSVGSFQLRTQATLCNTVSTSVNGRFPTSYTDDTVNHFIFVVYQ